MFDAVDIMLSLQNPGGGFASFELVRGPWWLEWLNAAEVFGEKFHRIFVNGVFHQLLGDIMIEYCYPECTTSAITSLATFKKYYPDYRSQDIECVMS
jgi:lanosterol synthase